MPMYQEVLDTMVVLKTRGCPGSTDELMQDTVARIEALSSAVVWTEHVARRHKESLAQLT